MTYVHIEIDDYLHEISASSLKAEVRRRIQTKEWKWGNLVDEDGAEPWAPATLAEDLREAFYRRDASRFEMLLRVLAEHESA